MKLLNLTKLFAHKTSMPSQTASGSRKRNWSAYNAAKINERALFPILLYELCLCIEEPEQRRGRHRLSLRDMLFCTVLKVFSKSPLRQFAHDTFAMYHQRLIQRVPHYNSISHYMRMELLTEKLTKLIEISSYPLKAVETIFAVDSTGLSTCRYARWLDYRDHQERARRQWIKLHLICGVTTNIVTSVITTAGSEADAPRFGRLVEVTARNFRLQEVLADKAYLSGENIRWAVSAKATPFIPFKENNRLDADYKSTVWKKMLHMYLCQRAEFLDHYHKRNNVEATFHMIKANFGARLLSVSRQAQYNEALCKVLAHNICVLIHSMFVLGIDISFCSESAYDLKRNTKPMGQVLSMDQLRKLRQRIPALLKGIRKKLAR